MRISPTRLLCAALGLLSLVLVSSVTRLLFGRRGFDLLPQQPGAANANANAADTHDADAAGGMANVRYGEECAPFTAGALDHLTVVVKLGAGEVATQLPAYLARLTRCTRNVLLFSDRPAHLAGFDVVDALANLRPEYKYHNPDFDIYDRIQHADVQDLQEKTFDGWRLDKYKFLPMIELADARRPTSQWFLFLELDTYVNWDNLHRFLVALDPATPHYFGSPVWPRKKPVFAHGGSGFVLSRGAVNKLMARGRMFAENHRSPGTHLFGKDLRTECCGDEVLAKVLKESGIPLRGYWPLFNSESPSTLRFAADQWCEAVVTMHRVNTDDAASLSHWETTARDHPETPLTFASLFAHIEPGLVDRRDAWTNLSDDVEFAGPNKKAAKSWDACRAACVRDRGCLQFEHRRGSCRLGRSVRLGHAVSGESDVATAGWMTARVQAFKTKAARTCRGAHVPHANPR